jgi:uncharacterized protein YbcI
MSNIDAMGMPQPRSTGGQLNAAISNAVLHVHSRYVGRGPSGAQVFFRHNVVVVVLHDVMTRAERSLVSSGQAQAAMDLRRQCHQTMRDDLVAAVEGLTGRGVVAFMSDSHLEPDVASQLFILDGEIPCEHDDELRRARGY